MRRTSNVALYPLCTHAFCHQLCSALPLWRTEHTSCGFYGTVEPTWPIELSGSHGVTILTLPSASLVCFYVCSGVNTIKSSTCLGYSTRPGGEETHEQTETPNQGQPRSPDSFTHTSLRPFKSRSNELHSQSYYVPLKFYNGSLGTKS